MPQFRSLRAFILGPVDRSTAARLAVTPGALLAHLAVLALVTSTLGAQGSAASDTPLHLAANRFDFVVSGDAEPAGKPLRIHNGGAARRVCVRQSSQPHVGEWRGTTV
ncbi:MAG TPA: hypothetical protein VE861_16075, partial [Gemmatimonadaceae bacterium]|nr:hypothetical protein [Gemmatimonadaceae bacterium]